MGYQSPARELKGVYSHDNSDSDNEERCKKLYVMFDEVGNLSPGGT